MSHIYGGLHRKNGRECDFDEKTGCIDIEHLNQILTNDVAGVYFEVPNYFGGNRK